MNTTTFIVNDLCCSDEERVIREKLATIAGVEIRGINIVEKTVHVNHSCAPEIILDALRDAGLEARLLNDVVETPSFWKQHGNLILIAASILALSMGIAHSLIWGTNEVSIGMYVVCVLFSGWSILLKGLKAITKRSLDMNFLMTVATVGAMAIGKWEEGAVVMFLFALAELLESFSVRRSRNAIHSLLTLVPKTANRMQGNGTVAVSVKDIKVGERILIRPGEQVPLDGKIISGASSVNQASITGESKPVRKTVGDEVFAGSYNEQGSLELEITKPHSGTMLARIVRLVEEAQDSRAPVQTLVDKFAKYYTPIVFGIACLVALVPPLVAHQQFAEWFYRALVLLVIACPCALVLSTPITVMSGLANAARNGVLIKGGRFLEALAGVKAVAFDKTGTLTKGTPKVTDIVSLNSLSQEGIIKLASLVERNSEHLLAHAVKRKASDDSHDSSDIPFQHFESVTGKGVRAVINGVTYIVGSHQLIEDMGICSPAVEESLERFEKDGRTTIILATEQEPLGIIAIADEVRQEAATTIQQLRDAGVVKAIMLTGDNQATANSIARQAGIDEFNHEVLPEGKMQHIAGLKERYGSVAMVGDGINDAPALASATIGIAMGATGTDVSLEAADVVLMSDELTNLPYAINLSKKTIQIIKQNIVIALVTKIIFLVLGVFGIATLWMAILADDGATLAVILNGLRVLRFQKK